MKPVAILGTGPAGLIAAQAVAMAGHPIALFGVADDDGKIKRSEIHGAQFLHKGVPGATNIAPDATVTLTGVGDAETYRAKVYPDVKVPFVSFRPDTRTEPVWRMEDAYDRLWDLLSADSANVQEVTPAWLDEAKEAGWFSAVISSIPAPALCRRIPGHDFRYQEISVLDKCMLESLDDNTVFYDGTEDRSWYRTSKLFGHGSTEWSGLAPAGLFEEDTVFTSIPKPIATTCDCFPDIMRVGRMGTWTKGVLAHQVFEEVTGAL